MQKSKFFTFVGIAILVLALASVRFFEKNWFYDPFILFFKGEYHHKDLPDFDFVKLSLHYLLRYSINSILSLAILYFWFKEIKLIKDFLIIYAIAFVVLFLGFSILVLMNEPKLSILFYVRRFLIQPLFLVLFVPALLYQKTLKTKDVTKN
ncbi:MAG: exosortase F system-associated membrane protein [Flavobacterium sp.]